jgi:Ca2+-binding RTX toxin-like protein
MNIYVRVQFVTLHQFRPADYGSKIVFGGATLDLNRYGLAFGNQDPGLPPGHDGFDYAEFQVVEGRTGPSSAIPDFLARDSYTTEYGSSGYARWRSVEVPDGFLIPAPGSPGGSAWNPDPFADVLSEGTDMAMSALAGQVTRLGLPADLVQSLYSNANLGVTLGQHLANQMAAIHAVVEGRMDLDGFDAATALAADRLSEALEGQLPPELRAVVPLMAIVMDMPWGGFGAAIAGTVSAEFGAAVATPVPFWVSRGMILGAGDDSLVLVTDLGDIGAGGSLQVHAGAGNDRFVAAAEGAILESFLEPLTWQYRTPFLIDGGAGLDSFDARPIARDLVLDLTPGLSARGYLHSVIGQQVVHYLSIPDNYVGPILSVTDPLIDGDVAVPTADVFALLHRIETIRFGGGNDRFTGDETANTVEGGGGRDWLLGQAGNDHLDGGAGDDLLNGGSGNDRMAGGLGNDHYIVAATGDLILGEVGFSQGGGIDTVTAYIDFDAPANVEILRAGGGVAGVDLTGNDAPGTLVGNALANRLDGRGGNDQLNGNAGNDTLTGGEGADTLVGGAGADQFIYNAVSNSRAGAANRDVINGFDRGATQDIINLDPIDANTGLAGDQDFTFIGMGAFTGAGQVRVLGLGGANAVIVEVNVNADLAADMQIFVNLQTTMVATDFDL